MHIITNRYLKNKINSPTVRLSDDARGILWHSLPDNSARAKSCFQIDPKDIIAVEEGILLHLVQSSDEDLKTRTRSAVWPILVANIIK
jgi:hypothetical protein